MRIIEMFDFRGVKMPKEFFEFENKLKELEVRNDDVWITSYPKTGSTWAAEMTWLIANNLDYEAAKEPLPFRFPFIEFDTLPAEYDRFAERHKLNRSQSVRPNFYDIVRNNKNRRFIKTHLPWDFLPKDIVNGSKTPKIIHVIRNPKQVLPSYYHHTANLRPTFIGSLEEFLDLYVNDNVQFGGYFRTVLTYWEQKHKSNLLIITYEEMIDDIKTVIRKVSEFLGKSYDNEEIEKLAKHLSFREMKTNIAVNGQFYIRNEERQFMRKGSANSYKEELSMEMIEKLDRWVMKNIKGTGLPYENE